MASTERAEKRKKAAEEILVSERVYVGDMQTFVRVFVEGFREKLDHEDIVLLFSNIEELLALNEGLLRDLESEFKRCEETKDDAMIGPIFIKVSPWLMMFSTFVNNHQAATDRYKELMYPTSLLGTSSDEPSGPHYELLCQLEEKPECRGNDLLSFLIMPIQRIPRYRMLLDALIKYTPFDHKDYNHLIEALKKIVDVADMINESLRNYENRAKVMFIHEQFSSAAEIIAPHRKFVKEDDLKKVCRKGPKPYRFVLFNDCLIYGTPSVTTITEPIYKLQRLINIKHVTVSSVDPVGDEENVTFQISSPAKSFHVKAPSPKVKEEWMETLQKTIDASLQPETSRIHSRTISAGPALSPLVPTRGDDDSVGPVSPTHTRPKSKSRVVKWLPTSGSNNIDELSDPEDGSPNNPTSPTAVDSFAPAPVWVPDKEAPKCMICSEKFTLLIRRHHCRQCGKVVCDKCSPHKWHLPNINKKKPQRICNECYEKIIAKFESMAAGGGGATQAPSGGGSGTGPSPATDSKTTAGANTSGGGTSSIDNQSFPRPAAPQEEPDEGHLAVSVFSTNPLPPNWFMFRDEKDRPYYWNKITTIVQWERPTGRVSVRFGAASSSSGSSTPQGPSSPRDASKSVLNRYPPAAAGSGKQAEDESKPRNVGFSLSQSNDDSPTPPVRKTAFGKIRTMVMKSIGKSPFASPITNTRKTAASSTSSKTTTASEAPASASPPAKPEKPKYLAQTMDAAAGGEAAGVRTSARDLAAKFEAKSKVSVTSVPQKKSTMDSPKPSVKFSMPPSSPKPPVNASNGPSSASASSAPAGPIMSIAERMEAYRNASTGTSSAPRSRRDFEKRRAGNLAELLRQDGFKST